MSYWYLASPYSEHPDGLAAAWVLACNESARLMRAGVPVFSPVVHNHAVGLRGGLDVLNTDVWLKLAEAMMENARGLIVLRGPGWEGSTEIHGARAAFLLAGKPSFPMDPGTMPDGLVAAGVGVVTPA